MTVDIRNRLIRPQGAPRSDINVTPLVDVVLVLLIIFMVVTPLMVKDIAVQLPPVTEGASGTQRPPQQVVVAIHANGQVTVDDTPVSEEEYIPRLRELMEARAPRERVAFFLPDDRARYGRLVAVIDGAKSAGVETLGMVTTPPEDAPSPAPR